MLFGSWFHSIQAAAAAAGSCAARLSAFAGAQLFLHLLRGVAHSALKAGRKNALDGLCAAGRANRVGQRRL